MSEFIKKKLRCEFSSGAFNLVETQSSEKLVLFLLGLKIMEGKYMLTVLTKKEVMVHSISDR